MGVYTCRHLLENAASEMVAVWPLGRPPRDQASPLKAPKALGGLWEQNTVCRWHAKTHGYGFGEEGKTNSLLNHYVLQNMIPGVKTSYM
jgi:hypothetical protein